MRRAALALLAASLLGLAACGGEETDEDAIMPITIREPGGTLKIAAKGQIDTLDPLYVGDRAERLAARQVHEPLLTRQSGPFDQATRRPGLVRTFKPQANDTIWTAELRRGVRFQSGESFDSDAVKANVERWQAVVPELLPDLIAPDSPRPGVVRFLLSKPSPEFPKLLADARLGIAAPNAIAGLGDEPLAPGPTGTGPFEFRERTPESVLLVRNPAWWGAGLGLGPGLDQIELERVDTPKARATELVAGTIEVATGLRGEAARRVARAPLLSTVSGDGTTIGIERSVRGISSADDEQSLADVWLTDLR